MPSEQKLYRTWQQPIMSKDSVEDLAIINGIGPQFGFDACSWNNTSGVLTLGSDTEGTNPNSVQQIRQITTRSGDVQNPTYAVITPDGIISVFFASGANVDALPVTGLGTTREILLVATHVYVESTIESPTSFNVIVNSGSDSWLDALKADGSIGSTTSNMSTWETIFTTAGIDRSTTIAIGVFRLPATTGLITEQDFAIPYKYAWRNGISPGGIGGGGITEEERYPIILADDDLEGYPVEDAGGETRNFRIYNNYLGGINGFVYSTQQYNSIRSVGWSWQNETLARSPLRGRAMVLDWNKGLYQFVGWFYTRALAEIESTDLAQNYYLVVNPLAGCLTSFDRPWAVAAGIPIDSSVRIISENLEIRQNSNFSSQSPPAGYNDIPDEYPDLYSWSSQAFRIQNGSGAPIPVLPFSDGNHVSVQTSSSGTQINCLFDAVSKGFGLSNQSTSVVCHQLDLLWKWDVFFEIE